MTATEWFFQGHFPGLPVMPGVLQVEALAQTMAVYVAKQPGFGDRIGLFAGIDDVPLQAGRAARATRSGSRSRWRSSAAASGAGRGVASVDGEVACEATSQLHHPGRRRARDDRGSPSSSDVHGNAVALEAVRKAIRTREARRSSRSPATSCSTARTRPAPSTRLRELEAEGAADRRRATPTSPSPTSTTRRAFPWLTGRRPGHDPRRRRVGPRRSSGDERLDWLRRLPAERRLRTTDDTLVLVCHASPGSQTAGFDQALDAERHHRAAPRHRRPGHRCGHTHIPEVRDLGWKLIVNAGSAGYVFDGDPTASWARDRHRRRATVTAEIRRTEFDVARRRERDLRARPARRRLPGRHGPHREARPMTGPDRAPRRVVVTGMGARDGARQRRRRRPGTGWSPAGPASGTIEAFDPSRADRRGSPPRSSDFDASGVLDRKELRRTDRYIQFGARGRPRGARPGRPARRGSRASSPSGPASSWAPASAASGTLIDSITINADARPGPDQPVLHPDGHPQHRRRPDRDPVRHDRARTSRPCRPARPAATRIGEAWRDRSAAATPTSWSRAAPRPASTRRSSAASRRCGRCRRATTTRRAPRGRSTPAATASSSARAPASLVLEALEHAEARGATILAELVGYGATADASHITLPAPGGIGAVRAARRALDEGRPRRRPTSTTSTPTRRRRPRATRPSCRRSGRSSASTRRAVSITANKSMLGHTLGAAGAIEAIVTILTIRDGCVPPTINLDRPGPGRRRAST